MPEPLDNEKPAMVLVGARDWDFARWNGDFYPDDLPASWRLTYYANEYAAVLLPEPRWTAASQQTLTTWCEDVAGSFRFFLELSQPPRDEAVRSRLAGCAEALGGQFGGVLVRQAGRELPDRLPEILAGRWFQVLALPPPGEDLDLRAGSQPRALVAEAQQLGGLGVQRRIIENLASELRSQGEIPVFLEGNPPSFKAVQELRQLVELMGLA